MTHALDVSVKSINIPDTNDVIEMYLLDCSGRFVSNNDILLSNKHKCKLNFCAVNYEITQLYLHSIYREVYRDLLTGPPWQQTDMIVAVYDVTKEETFEKVTKVTHHKHENYS